MGTILIHAYEISHVSLIPIEDWPEDSTYKGIDPPTGFGVLQGTVVKPLLFKEDPGYDEAKRMAIEVIRPKRGHLLHLDVRRLNPAPWHQAWFSHVTLRMGRSDDDLRRDFEQFVSQSQREWDGPEDAVMDKYNARCLMGAEDRWRWSFCDCEKCRDGGAEAVVKH